MFSNYDVIVVGAGHAGCEAAAAAAKMGSRTLLVTLNMDRMATMSCNPAMGGVAKGQILRELDAMGGLSAKVADRSAIQFRMLNRSKGPAMWSPRTQNDRALFSLYWREELEKIQNLYFWQDNVVNLIVEKQTVKGVITQLGYRFYGKTVILTNGTFLNGTIHIGTSYISGGRIGEQASSGITEQLNQLGIQSFRMKTGTPVRIDGRTIDFSKLIEQKGDDDVRTFSYFPDESLILKKQMSCYLAYTSPKVHDILKLGFNDSPLFQGIIKGTGPRYCPSIEDKIERFSSKDRHQLFVEPEGWTTIEYYLNGFSSSLPAEIQFKALRTIEGFEKAEIFRPGYAIEYDYFPPTQLKPTLETKHIENLFFAGQINGTTGYEEAAAQGFMAAVNAHQKIRKSEGFILKRHEAYIGVLIDDLVTKGTNEPYRMFTSRAEYRILLRQNNADLRLTKYGKQFGLVSNDYYEKVLKKEETIANTIAFLKEQSITPDQINAHLEIAGTSGIKHKVKQIDLLTRPQIDIYWMQQHIPEFHLFVLDNQIVDKDILEEIEIQIKYAGYIEKEQNIADKLIRFENLKIPLELDYHSLPSLSFESREKLTKIQPQTIGQAARISGVSPSDISVLLIYLSK